MNIRITNQLNMVGTCITTASDKDYLSVWREQEPSAFSADLVTLKNDYEGAVENAKRANAADGGATDSKAVIESRLEDHTFRLARALAVYFKKKGDLTSRAHVDVSRTEIVQMRENDLVTKATTIRDLGAATLVDPESAPNGINKERVEAVTKAIIEFKTALTQPRGQIVNRSTLLRELETDTASLLEQLRDLDDLVLQFDGRPNGDRFIEAWKKARVIVDRGHSVSGKAPAPNQSNTPSAGAKG